MILKVEKIGLSLEIERKLLYKMLRSGEKHYPNEFGGFLVGFYSNNNKHLRITDSIFPVKYKSSRYNFERSTEGIEEQLYNLYNEHPSKFYIGEWHTHPDNSATPSITDIFAIFSIVNATNSCIKNPVLLIIGYNKTKIDFSFYVFFNNNLHQYE